ncbi:MAG: HD domain-containing protein [Nanoarchaeota archaeon]
MKSETIIRNAHADQKYKDDSPYWIHPCRVAMIVAGCTEKESIISAAYGHDLLEDTDVSEDEIAQFGQKALHYIKIMTNKQEDHDTTDYIDKPFKKNPVWNHLIDQTLQARRIAHQVLEVVSI